MPGPDAAPLAAVLVFMTMLYGSPGPATLSLAASGATVGFWRSLPFLTGIVVGLLFSQTLAAAGLAVLLRELPPVRVALFVASLAYVLWLAARVARHSTSGPQTRAFGLLDGLVLNLLNPKAYLVSLATFSQFGGPDRWPLAQLVAIGCALGLVVDITWCAAGGVLRRWTAEEGPAARRVRYSMASLLVLSVAMAVVKA